MNKAILTYDSEYIEKLKSWCVSQEGIINDEISFTKLLESLFDKCVLHLNNREPENLFKLYFVLFYFLRFHMKDKPNTFWQTSRKLEIYLAKTDFKDYLIDVEEYVRNCL